MLQEEKGEQLDGSVVEDTTGSFLARTVISTFTQV